MPIPQVDPTARPTLAKRIITPPARTSAGKWALMNISRRVDPTLVRLTRGKLSTLVFTPAVVLTHTGAKSGIERTTAGDSGGGVFRDRQPLSARPTVWPSSVWLHS
ncbi:MAG TPA: hypothetical protein VGF21_13580 [Thermoleophilaceae bacterium]|jgi:hypothetical protein